MQLRQLNQQRDYRGNEKVHTRRYCEKTSELALVSLKKHYAAETDNIKFTLQELP